MNLHELSMSNVFTPATNGLGGFDKTMWTNNMQGDVISGGFNLMDQSCCSLARCCSYRSGIVEEESGFPRLELWGCLEQRTCSEPKLMAPTELEYHLQAEYFSRHFLHSLEAGLTFRRREKNHWVCRTSCVVVGRKVVRCTSQWTCQTCDRLQLWCGEFHSRYQTGWSLMWLWGSGWSGTARFQPAYSWTSTYYRVCLLRSAGCRTKPYLHLGWSSLEAVERGYPTWDWDVPRSSWWSVQGILENRERKIF